MSTETTTRNATLADMHTILTGRKARSRDIVVPAASLRSKDGLVIVKGVDPEITAEGVTLLDGSYRPTAIFDEGLSDKLGIPLAYVRRLRETRSDLFDANVNGLLHGKSILRVHQGTHTELDVIHPADERKFMVRTLRGEDGGLGVARALLSDQFKAIDDIDVLTASLRGMEKAGVIGSDTLITGSLTDRRMYVDVTVPSVSALAPVLLHGYRSPFDGPNPVRRPGTDPLTDLRERYQHGQYGHVEEPIVFVGFRVSNSEVGSGRATVTPKITVLACTNGMLIKSEAIGFTHSGGRLDEGLVSWSSDTYRAKLEVITDETADAVATFLSPEFLADQVRKIEERAGRPVEHPEDTVKDVTKSLGFTLSEQQGVLSHFVRGGQMTSGGLLNAVTSYSQTRDADRQHELDSVALKVLDRV